MAWVLLLLELKLLKTASNTTAIRIQISSVLRKSFKIRSLASTWPDRHGLFQRLDSTTPAGVWPINTIHDYGPAKPWAYAWLPCESQHAAPADRLQTPHPETPSPARCRAVQVPSGQKPMPTPPDIWRGAGQSHHRHSYWGPYPTIQGQQDGLRIV